MPIYQQQGNIPKKRHIVFNKQEGGLHHEEPFGTEGFASTSSLVYHLNPPTSVKEMGEPYSVKPKIAIEDNLKALSFSGFDIPSESDYIKSKNNDLSIGIARPERGIL